MCRNVHVGVKLRERFVKVIHLSEDANNHDNAEDVGAGMGKLVIAGKGELDSNSESFDSHNGY